MSKVNCVFDETGTGKGKMKKLKYLLLLLLFARLLDLQSQVEEEGEIAKRDDDRQGSIPYRSCTCRMHALTNPRLTFPHLPHTPSFGSNLSFFFIAFYHQQLKEEDTFSISSSAFPIALLSFVRSFVVNRFAPHAVTLPLLLLQVLRNWGRRAFVTHALLCTERREQQQEERDEDMHFRCLSLVRPFVALRAFVSLAFFS